MVKQKGMYVYIDAANLNGSAVACGYKRINYTKLFNWLKTAKGAERIYLYAAHLEGDAQEEADFLNLEGLGYVLRLKKIMQYPPEYRSHKLTCPNCKSTHRYTIKRTGRSKANCDSELTLDVMNDGLRRKYSSVVVFSGDGDFARMHEYIAEVKKKMVVVYSPMSGIPGKRTSTAIKTLHNNGTITLESLEGILINFGVK